MVWNQRIESRPRVRKVRRSEGSEGNDPSERCVGEKEE